MKYAVLRIQGHQYKVEEGETFNVDKIDGEVKPEVLLVVDGENVKVGDPIVKDAKVKLSVVEELVKGEKIRVFKFKAKSRYKKTRGFRAQLTTLKLEKIS